MNPCCIRYVLISNIFLKRRYVYSFANSVSTVLHNPFPRIIAHIFGKHEAMKMILIFVSN